jgi:Ca2+-binding RTX toxin-like protein
MNKIPSLFLVSFLITTFVLTQSYLINQAWAAVIQCEGGNEEPCNGTPENDVIHGNPSPNDIFGLQGDDIISGYAENDNIAGEEGDDNIFGGIEHDEISGGEGDDNIIDIQGDEAISGGNGNDFISDNSGQNTLRGDDNQFSADIGDDRVTGGVGEDVIDGGFGTDRLNGRDGNDRISHAHESNTTPDGRQDFINCGPGGQDEAWINEVQDRDITINCEIVHNELETS